MRGKKRRKFFLSSKSQRKNVQVIGQWKPVNIDSALLGDEGFGNLVCFEELTEYQLVSASKLTDEETRKRKSDNLEVSECSEKQKIIGNDLPEWAQTRKKKMKKMVTVDHTGDEVGITDFSEDMNQLELSDKNETAEAETNVTAASKKRKRKKKKSVVSQSSTPAMKMKNWTMRHSCSSEQTTDVSAWKDLFVPEPVLRALSSLGYTAPTPIQALVLPPAIRDKLDILGAAETGSGKTLAFAIPMIHLILEWRKAKDAKLKTSEEIQHGIQDTNDAVSERLENTGEHLEEYEEADGIDENPACHNEGSVKVIHNVNLDLHAASNIENPLLGLVLTPTRELAVQVKHHIDAVAKFTGIKTATIVGGMATQKQERVLNCRPEIVIATPGRLWELIKERHPHLCHLKQLRCLVIDEADRMVEKGHFSELCQLLEMLHEKEYHPKRRIFIFSATLTMVHQAPARLLGKKNVKTINTETKLEALIQKVGIKRKPKIIDLSRKEGTVETLTETRIHCEKEEKDFYLYYFLLQYPGRTMVFANSIDCIKRLNALLTILECNPLPLHANMHQKQRLKNLERFAERESCVLLTTDVAARGLDIPNVQHVIHYQVPRTSEVYVHRSGRTARATKAGLALMLVGPSDMIHFKKICKTLGKDENIPLFPVQAKCMSAIKARVNIARSIEKMEYQHNKAQQHNSWFQQAAEALEVDLEDDVLMDGDCNGDEKQRQRTLKGMKKQLKYLLLQSVFKNYLKTKYPTQFGRLTLPNLPLASQETALSTVKKHKNTKKRKLCEQIQ
ncbi:ATP-dependent RNA helicase DDX24 [Stegostoma tigrinum]|uniref:ATP-dependent RNA helicase DDX24 n=1 Tax=Stegostoma tigrinum TaxID=3053191 RepID=UPI00202B739B|nr:ATP-dependent RNA helicase DDX24 [Stegostoma tigrinum]XP_048393496.1 ATP-dependent RNA helicase DDX24 [Stegostoma tigrinum]XP_048393497.1 ATP-dependent RNA helicase DDX24 [Stegostoma tigrinum]